MLQCSMNSSRAYIGNVRVASVLAMCAKRASVRAISTAKALIYERNGDPADVLQLKEQQMPEVGEQDAQIQIIAVRNTLQSIISSSALCHPRPA